MSIVERNLPVTMVRANLDVVPDSALPAGFALRWYQPGDEENWLRIHRAADQYNEIAPELFRRQFGSVEHLLRERQCYLLDKRGHAVGTGTAWFNDNFDGVKFGRVHWMAILPEFQGRGLARPLMTAVCRRLRELGHDRAYLSTSTARLPAIHLYRQLGFVPLVKTDQEAAAWHELDAILRTADRTKGHQVWRLGRHSSESR